MARVAGAVVMTRRSRELAEAASRTLRSTAVTPFGRKASDYLPPAQSDLYVRAGVRRHDHLLRGRDAPGEQRRVDRHRALDQGQADRAELVVPRRRPGEPDARALLTTG